MLWFVWSLLGFSVFVGVLLVAFFLIGLVAVMLVGIVLFLGVLFVCFVCLLNGKDSYRSNERNCFPFGPN